MKTIDSEEFKRLSKRITPMPVYFSVPGARPGPLTTLQKDQLPPLAKSIPKPSETPSEDAQTKKVEQENQTLLPQKATKTEVSEKETPFDFD